METPPYLIGQYAAEHKLSATMAKRALYLQGLDTSSRKVNDTARLMGLAPATLKAVARKLIIDFSDYRPYAKRRDAGEVVGPTSRDIHRPASELPIFGSASA